MNKFKSYLSGGMDQTARRLHGRLLLLQEKQHTQETTLQLDGQVYAPLFVAEQLRECEAEHGD